MSTLGTPASCGRSCTQSPFSSQGIGSPRIRPQDAGAPSGFSSHLQQPRGNFSYHRIGFFSDLIRRLILNRMLDVDRVKVGASECFRLNAGGFHKFCRRDSYGGNSERFKFRRVVQTARGTRTSIG